MQRPRGILIVINNRKSWTTEEDNFLIKNYKLRGCAFCAKFLKRTKNSVTTRASKLKITLQRIKRAWSQNDIDFLIKNYSQKGKKFCANYLNRTMSSVSNKCFNLKLRSFEEKDLSHLENINTPEIAYWKGLLWADGGVSQKNSAVKIKIAKKDMDNIKNILFLALGPDWTYSEYQPQKITLKGNVCKLMAGWYVSNKKYHEFLEQNDYAIKSGASACKILSKIPENLQHYWWRGYFDGDGCFPKTKNLYSFIITSCYEQDWTFLKILLEKLNIKYQYIQRKSKDSKSSKIKADNYYSMKTFGDYIYQGKIFGLERKYQIFLDKIQEKEINKICTPKKTKVGISGFKGVKFDKDRKNKPYLPRIKFNKKEIYLGRYTTPEEAARAYDKKAFELFGNRAILNFPLGE